MFDDCECGTDCADCGGPRNCFKGYSPRPPPPPHAPPMPPYPAFCGDDSKCTSLGGDCCACDASIGMTRCNESDPNWNESATCSDGYIPIPQEDGVFSGSYWSQNERKCRWKSNSVGSYSCFMPDTTERICEKKCADSQRIGDGICDDGGPDSIFSVCAYGTDCGDCCPRDPKDDPRRKRYNGPIDVNLTRMVCTRGNEEDWWGSTIKIDYTSPCMNRANYTIHSNVGVVNLTQEKATMVVVLLLMALCVAVLLILVPVAVYAQLVYSGRWPALTGWQRFMCMLNGNFEYQGVQAEQKRKEKFINYLEQYKWQGIGCGSSSKGGDKGVANHWFHFVYIASYLPAKCIQKPETAEAKTAKPGVEAQITRPACTCEQSCAAACLWPPLFWPLFVLVVLVFRCITLDIIFDIIPLAFDKTFLWRSETTFSPRALVKAMRLLAASYVLAHLLMRIPEQNASDRKSVV